MSGKNAHCKTQVLLYAPLLVWMAGIFYLSSLPGSGAAYEMPRAMLIERKGAHIFEYFILTLLWVRVFSFLFSKNERVAMGFSILSALIYAVSDEIHQLFVFARTGKLTDVLIDSIGIFIASALFVRFFDRLPAFYQGFFIPRRKGLPRRVKKTTIKVKK
ncbi:MAG: VanZ family protein [Candidatus Moranbacteria bacterium]|nr:VanZ family protein [Candidatus Moranbacteria bacterium]